MNIGGRESVKSSSKKSDKGNKFSFGGTPTNNNNTPLNSNNIIINSSESSPGG